MPVMVRFKVQAQNWIPAKYAYETHSQSLVTY